MDHAETLYEQVRRLRREQRLDEALALLEARLERVPGDLFAKSMLAGLLNRMRRHDQARQVVGEILRVAPDHVGGLTALGDIESSNKNFAAAVEAFALAEQAGPDGKSAAYLAGRKAWALGRMNRTDEALGTLAGALIRFPDDAMLLRTRIELLLAAGRQDEAALDLARLTALRPDDVLTRKLVLAVRTKGRPAEEVDRQIEGALASSAGRGDPGMWSLKAQRAWDAGRWLDAAESFLALHRIDPGERFALQRAGFAFKRAGDDLRAAECLESAFLDDPADRYVRACLLGCLQRLGQFDRIESLLDRATARHPQVRLLLGLKKKFASRHSATPRTAKIDP